MLADGIDLSRLLRAVFRIWYLSTLNQSLRFLLMAGALAGLLWCLRSRLAWRKLQSVDATGAQRRREIGWSLASCGVFAAVQLPILILWKTGATRIYQDITEWGTLYFVASLGIVVALHDTYFYWVHRLLHSRLLGRFHALHHSFTAPTAWAAFALHPVEAALQAGIYPLLALTVPLHPMALAFLLFVSAAHAVWIHCGYDLLPHVWGQGPGQLNTSLEHDDHHARGHGNFGLYFTFWDRALGTLRPPTSAARATARLLGRGAMLHS